MKQKASENENRKKDGCKHTKTKDSTITYNQVRKRLQTDSNDKVSTFYLLVSEKKPINGK